MSFGDISRDTLGSSDDVGLVYTRNKYGRVFLPPGYELRGKNVVFINDWKSLFKGANCSVSTGEGTFNPQSFFLICLDFVAKNVTMVESLEGFPDIVGKQLFHKVRENKGFGSNPKNLKLFCEAYGEPVLSKLSLASEHILINNYLECLRPFVFLTELDVSHCRLGDDHELLEHISHNLHGLIKLSIKDNSLSDTGVRKFTLPQRLLQNRLEKLSILDLSWNHRISDTAIKYIMKINSLTALNLSATGVSCNGVTQLVNNSNLCPSHDVDEFKSDKVFTATEGWAVDVINDWAEKSKHSTTSSRTNTRGARGQLFYKPTPELEMLQMHAKRSKLTRFDKLAPVLMFTLKKHKLTCVQSKAIHPNVETAARDCKDESERNGQPRKKFKATDGHGKPSSFSSEETLEDELFKEYLNCKWVRVSDSPRLPALNLFLSLVMSFVCRCS